MPNSRLPTHISLANLGFVGAGLVRPECVLATSNGSIYCADWRGGVVHLSAQGDQKLVKANHADGRPLRPNGIALRADGSWLFADLGDAIGGVYVLAPSGALRPFLESVDGLTLPPANFVHEDAVGRVWITVSTRHRPRARAYRHDIADGFIVLVDQRGARIVADQLGYTNEALVSPDGRHLYVNETFARRLVRFAISADGELGSRELITEFGAGTFPDGLTFDAEGGVWVTSVVSNRVIHVARDGTPTIVLEDVAPDHLARVEAAYVEGTMGREHLDHAGGRVLRNISSLAFGGPDLRTAYLGCLLGDSIATFRAPVAGNPPVHWHYPSVHP